MSLQLNPICPSSKYKIRLGALVAFTLAWFAAVDAPVARAVTPEAYLKALKLAEKKVLRQKSAGFNAQALSSSAIRGVYGRYYQVGDSWDVAAWRFDSGMARMTGDPTHLGVRTAQGGIFHYEVTAVRGGTHPRVTLRVTQKPELGLSAPDARVESLELDFDDQAVQTRKTYRFHGVTEPVPVAPDGLHSAVTILELYPLDVPEFVTAEKLSANSIPELPPEIQSVAELSGFHPDLSRSFRFEQEDFFGRPVQLLWQFGDPWPAFLKTSNGIAILIRKGANS